MVISKTGQRIATALLCLVCGGCIEKQSSNQQFTPFEAEELDACLAIVVDLSGSFREDWEQDGRAHRLFLELIDLYFNDGMGLNSKVVLGQISGSDQFILFDGSPQELARRFRTPESLNLFLQENSEPGGSLVHRSTKKMFDYLADIPDATESTRMLTVVLSDLKDSESNTSQREQSERGMLESLKNYSKSGGGVALYFVADEEKSTWRDFLKQAAFPPGSYVIEGELSESPQLPRFDQ